MPAVAWRCKAMASRATRITIGGQLIGDAARTAAAVSGPAAGFQMLSLRPTLCVQRCSTASWASRWPSCTTTRG